MKPLVKRILEAGLVDKHAALLLEKWGQLEGGASDLVGTTEEHLQKFVHDIATLLEEDNAGPVMRETVLGWENYPTAVLHLPPAKFYTVRLTPMGGFLIPKGDNWEDLKIGVEVQTGHGTKHLITGISDLYLNNNVVARELTAVQLLEANNAVLPKL